MRTANTAGVLFQVLGLYRSVPIEFHSVSDAKAVFDTNFFGIIDLSQVMSSLPSERLQLTKLKEADAEEIRTGYGPIVTSTAIEHALISVYPKTRYAVSKFGGMSGTLITWINWLTTDRQMDSIMDV
eukprot:gene31682-39134_t